MTHGKNLNAAKIELQTKPFKSITGLSIEMPYDNLPVNLSRGATPLGESFKMSRQTVEIAKVTAGSNQANAAKSFDDNEITDWSSDGKTENAWINYEFAKPSKINQVVIKMIGWRTNSYPLQISVDDKVVFSGNSPRSLGYVTFTFPETIGKSVKIQLKGEASNRDAFGNIIEIQGAPDKQSAADKGGKNILGIVEVEIYGKL